MPTRRQMKSVKRVEDERQEEVEEKHWGGVMANSVQRLYDVCNATFTRGTATVSSQSLHRVQSVLDCINPSDVGLDEEAFVQLERGFGFFGMRNFRKSQLSSMVARWAPPILYVHIYQCDEFSMGIFCLPTSAVIPLHNHPGMTVLSKLLYGSMHVKSYDWVDSFSERPDPANLSQARLARLVVDQVISAPCKPTVLYPTSGGNIHALTAVTPCAVLDVQAPPYSAADDRPISYFRDFPYSSQSGIFLENGNNVDGSKQCLAWLEEFQPPDDFVMKGAPYKGPRIAS